MKIAELNEARLNDAVEQFLGSDGIICTSKEQLNNVLSASLSDEINRNKKEFKREAKKLFDNFSTRNQAHAAELQGEAVEKKICTYFNRLIQKASEFDVSPENPLLFKAADGIDINNVVMPSLYRIEIGGDIPTKAGYFILSKDMKNIEIVYTNDKLTEFFFINILDEEEGYSYSSYKKIEPAGIAVSYKKRSKNNQNFHSWKANKDVVKIVEFGDQVLFAALNNYNSVRKGKDPQKFIYPETHSYDLDSLVALGEKEMSDYRLAACKDCGNVFAMSRLECEYFSDMLRLALPQRCPYCRKARRNKKKKGGSDRYA